MRPDGKPWDSGFSQPQHDFMTAETIYAAERANELKIGGHTDWTPERIQASAWTGQRIRSGEIPLEKAAETYPDITSKYTARGTRETTPGAATRHLEGLKDLPVDVQEEISRRYLDVFAPEGRDVITRMTDALAAGDITRGPGYWKGVSTPAYTAPMLAGREVKALPTWRGLPSTERQMAQIDSASRQQMNVSEATYALLAAQEAGAWNIRVLQKSPLSTHNAIDISLGRVPTREETLQLGRQMKERWGEDVAVTFTEDGFRLLNVEKQPDTGAVKQWVTQTRKDLSGQFGKDKIDSGYADLGYLADDWSSEAGRYGGEYLKMLRGQNPDVPIVSPELVAEGFDRVAPELARQLNKVDEWAQKTHGLNISPHIKKVRQAIAKDGIKGLQKLVATGSLPALLVLALTPYLEAGLSSAATDSS